MQNKKHRQPDLFCLIDGAKLRPFHKAVRKPYVNPTKKSAAQCVRHFHFFSNNSDLLLLSPVIVEYFLHHFIHAIENAEVFLQFGAVGESAREIGVV